MRSRKELQTLLSEKNLKKTSQRELIWGLLIHAKGHPSVEEMRDLLLARGHRIGLTTIYRTLKILLDAGMIRQSKLGGTTRYEAVVNQPNLVLADEPTGNLDSEHGAEVMKILAKLHEEGTSILMVTHSAENAAYAERTIRMLDGRILADHQPGRAS